MVKLGNRGTEGKHLLDRNKPLVETAHAVDERTHAHHIQAEVRIIDCGDAVRQMVVAEVDALGL